MNRQKQVVGRSLRRLMTSALVAVGLAALGGCGNGHFAQEDAGTLADASPPGIPQPQLHLELEARLSPSDGLTGDYFGAGVAFDGDTVIVGASGRGAAYVFVRTGASWTEQARLTGSDTQPGDQFSFGDQFGYAVALAGDLAVVGATNHDQGAGAVYVFGRDLTGAWAEVGQIQGGSHNALGNSLALDGDTLVVGARQRGYGCSSQPMPCIDPGKAFVYVREADGWTQQARWSGRPTPTGRSTAGWWRSSRAPGPPGRARRSSWRPCPRPTSSSASPWPSTLTPA
jgi:hypothetical protein